MEIKAFNFCGRRVIADQYLMFSWKQKVSECNLSDVRVVVWTTRECRGLIPYTFGKDSNAFTMFVLVRGIFFLTGAIITFLSLISGVAVGGIFSRKSITLFVVCGASLVEFESCPVGSDDALSS